MKDFRQSISATLDSSCGVRGGKRNWIVHYRFNEPIAMDICYSYLTGHFLNQNDIDIATLTQFRFEGKQVHSTQMFLEKPCFIDEMTAIFVAVEWKNIVQIVDDWWSTESMFIGYDETDFEEWEEESEEGREDYLHSWV